MITLYDLHLTRGPDWEFYINGFDYTLSDYFSSFDHYNLQIIELLKQIQVVEFMSIERGILVMTKKEDIRMLKELRQKIKEIEDLN